MGTSTGIALPRTSIGNLRVWVPIYIFRFRSTGGLEQISLHKLVNRSLYTKSVTGLSGREL